MRRATLIVLFGGLLCGVLARPASARKEYLDGFKEKYGGDKQLAPLIDDAKCFICHVGKKTKKNRNDYGKALSKLLMKEKNPAKINEALGKVEEEKSADGRTFGEQIKEHKLPVEPKKDD